MCMVILKSSKHVEKYKEQSKITQKSTNPSGYLTILTLKKSFQTWFYIHGHIVDAELFFHSNVL